MTALEFKLAKEICKFRKLACIMTKDRLFNANYVTYNMFQMVVGPDFMRACALEHLKKEPTLIVVEFYMN